ncbi:antA/AntB antirepressor family protein [Corynebacterium rouxii]|uniref:antA/AntB antirepressor family protein n=1 Tax=Corynebacterium rouxii TaxID=2719119 RepID=UPI003CF9E987
MSDLIPLANKDGIQAVMGRDLHQFLEVRRDYTNWMKQMIGYGFTEGLDFELIKEKVAGHAGSPNLANTRHNHIISLDMAKEISMIQRTDKGKQARQYFIECEQKPHASTAARSPASN